MESILVALERIKNTPLEEICKIVADEGEEIVSAEYTTGETLKNVKASKDGRTSADNGNNSWATSVTPTMSGAILSAYGEDVGFLEFGAGVDVNSDNDFVNSVAYDVAPGSYSLEHSRKFAEKGSWFYQGEQYRGIPASRGMQKALEHIRESTTPIKEINRWISGR